MSHQVSTKLSVEQLSGHILSSAKFDASYDLVKKVILVLLYFLNSVCELLTFQRKEKNFDRYEDLPGPPQLPIIGALHHLANIRETIEQLTFFGTKGGAILKFNIAYVKFVVLNNAPMVQTFLSSPDPEYLVKTPDAYDVAFKDLMGNGLLPAADVFHWKSHRRLLSYSFSYKCFQTYCKIFGRRSLKLVKNLEALFDGLGENETRQINITLHHTTFMSISEAVMGLTDLCTDEEGYKFYKALQKAKAIAGYRIYKGPLLLNIIFRLHPKYKEHKEAVDTIHTITRKMISKLKNSQEDSVLGQGETAVDGNENLKPANEKTMISQMVKGNFSEADMLHEVVTMIVAGFETSGAAVHYLMFLLALNPHQQKLCRDEVEEVFNDPMKFQNGELTYEGISDLKHLERCLFEALRLYPPVFAFTRKLHKPLRLSETLVIPKGVNVAIPQLTLHRNPEYFPNPDKFDPDRFLPENIKSRHPYAFLPFSNGTRNCIGNKFAVMLAKSMAAHILRNFEVYTTDKVDDVKLLPNIFLTPERDYNFHLKKRKF